MDWLSDWAGWVLKKGIPKIKDIAFLLDEPPCKFCLYWVPHKHGSGEMDLRLCTIDTMKNDFSCFRKKEATDDNV